MDEIAARYLAYRYMTTTDRRAPEVYDLCRRLLGFRGRTRHRVIWMDALDMVAMLAADNAMFAAGIRRRVEAAERRRAGTSVLVERRAA